MPCTIWFWPSALKGKAAFTTPLKATNRVVTGPYKTEAEARAMVNTLAKQGVSAFTFASVWKVVTSGRLRSCFSRCPDRPDSQ